MAPPDLDVTAAGEACLYVPAALAERVADQLATVAWASWQLAQHAGQIFAHGAVVSEAALAGLEELLAVLRPAAQVRAELAALDPDLLAAGARVWRTRRPSPAWPPAPTPCRVGGQVPARRRQR